MGLLDLLRGKTTIFSGLTDEEKRKALDLDEFYLQSVLEGRRGKVKVVEHGTDNAFVDKLTEQDIQEAIQIVRLQKKAITASDASNHREAVRLYEQIIAKTPFDSISLMSLGVQHAFLRECHKAVSYLKRALKQDPTNPRIRSNLEAVQRDFGLS
jgi:tetratricopeptide (TPR) repeat protein